MTSPTHPLLMLSHGEVDFDCLHVDRAPQDINKAALSSWALTEQMNGHIVLVAAYREDGSRTNPTMATEARLGEMMERSDDSMTPSLIHFMCYRHLARRAKGRLALPVGGTRMHCTPDLFALDMRDTEEMEDALAPVLRPRLGDMALSTSQSVHPDTPVFPIWHRTGQNTPISAHHALELTQSLRGQVQRILEVARGPGEVFSDRLLHA